jgi:hypothetical protein
MENETLQEWADSHGETAESLADWPEREYKVTITFSVQSIFAISEDAAYDKLMEYICDAETGKYHELSEVEEV